MSENADTESSKDVVIRMPSVESECDMNLDVGSHFETSIQFPSREVLVDWARTVGKSLSFAVTIKGSDKLDGVRARPRVFLGCDRGGSYRDKQCKKGWVKKNLRKTTTKRCGCPFTLVGKKNSHSHEWALEVKCGTHNHEMVHLEAHATAGRLDFVEKKIVQDMYASNVKPRCILSTLKKRNQDNRTVMRTIYNERYKLQKKELEGATPIQYLYKCLKDSGYLSYSRVMEGKKNLVSLFFAHPVAIKLSRMFSSVFLMDCTYKTNRYRLPLLSVVGVTSTQLTCTQTKEPILPTSLKGRPKGSIKKFTDDYKSTKRNPSLFEHVLKDAKIRHNKMSKSSREHSLRRNRLYDNVRRQLPTCVADYFIDVCNVAADGHCGFRVISESINMGDNWEQVRLDLMNELEKRNILYDSLFGSTRKQVLLNSLDCKNTPAPYDKWMTMPDMGLVISTCYNICVALISKNQSLTFLPLDAPLPQVPKTIWIGFINGNHFVRLSMKEGTPLPPLYSPWRRYHTQVGSSWECIINQKE